MVMDDEFDDSYFFHCSLLIVLVLEVNPLLQGIEHLQVSTHYNFILGGIFYFLCPLVLPFIYVACAFVY